MRSTLYNRLLEIKVERYQYSTYTYTYFIMEAGNKWKNIKKYLNEIPMYEYKRVKPYA